MKCIICGKGPRQLTLYRINAKGQPGKWACVEHLAKAASELPHDPALQELVNIIGKK